MNAQQILDQVYRLDAKLIVIDGKLKASPPGVLPPELKATIRDRAAEIKAHLHAERDRRTVAEPEPERNRWSERPRPPMPLPRCGALVCPVCHVRSPSPHREGCAFPRFDPCRSRWFWLSPHGAIKCVACATPPDMTLVEAWVLARETGEGDDGWRIPGEILSLLHFTSPPQ
jgi:tubulysin polyketide synthase-like protein